jgi:hypothetical protein
MRSVLLGFALSLVTVSNFAPAAAAQTNPASDASKAQSFDPHDLSGVWMDDHPRPNRVDERWWVYKFTPEEPSMTVWGLAQLNAAKTSFGPHPVPIAETNDPIYHTCAPMGFPRIFLYPLPCRSCKLRAKLS